MDWTPLIELATLARDRAYAPFSGFKVGAAVAMDDGSIYPGCNVENSSFGATICAERTAVTSAIAAGARRIQAVAVVTETDPPASPCGVCRQVLVEFGEPEVPVLLVGRDGTSRETTLGELHPMPFDFSEHRS